MDIKDIRVFGPGMWWSIHAMAYTARTMEEKLHFRDFVFKMQEQMFCSECKQHFGEYLEKFPIEEDFPLTDENDEELGCFYWTWKFHNAVNRRLNKETVTWPRALELFDPTKECHNCVINEPQVKRTVKYIPSH